MKNFSDIKLNENIAKSLDELGFISPTPIQSKTIPLLLDTKQDLIGAAQTGTGKTAAFSLPLLEAVSDYPSELTTALILTPTRELAVQIAESIEDYGKYLPLRSTVIFGGVKINPQIAKLRAGVDILVATPGRLLDHIRQKR